MYQELDLPSAEILVCLFLRGEGEASDQLAVTDFERRPDIHEGGISFFRKDQYSYKKMTERVGRQRKKRRGIATITVGQLRELGFRVFGDLKKDLTHVCVHCAECNGKQEDCVPKSADCPLLRPTGLAPTKDEHVLRTKLAGTMNILFNATVTKEELLTIFGKDVDDTKPVAANTQYEKRLNEYRASKGYVQQ